MTFDDYQKKASKTNTIDPKSQAALYYFALGLNGEAGEVAELLKKLIRNHDGDMSHLNMEHYTKELGDVLWYLSMLATQVGLSLDNIASTNIAKLADRESRNVIKSTGNNR